MLSPDFIRLLNSYPTDIFNRIEIDLDGNPIVSIRLNPAKKACVTEGLRPVAWNPSGYYLPCRRQFTFDPAFHQGRYYVQDASSMIIGRVVRQITSDRQPVRLLDACAAPGGKTTDAISSLPEGGIVIANEYDPRRASVLRENIVKWGSPSTIVTSGDTGRLSPLRNFFDIVLIDAPCSGEGMMRKDATAREQWSRGLVASCASTQREIVGNLADTIRTGGYLIYSTCTFNREENEENVAFFCREFGFESVEIDIPGGCGIDHGINTPHSCLRFIPGRVEGEGLFVALLRKTDNNQRPFANKSQRPKVAENKHLKSLIEGDFTFIAEPDGSVNAFPTAHVGTLEAVRKLTKIVFYGIELGVAKGKDFIPAHALAMSSALRTGIFAEVDIDHDEAIKYLQRETLVLPDDTPRGIVLLHFEGCPLGFVKNLGNRANNLYPQQFRILSRQ